MTTLAVPAKTCAGPCGQRLPWTEFYAAAKWPDGTMRRPRHMCKACDKAYRAEHARKHPEQAQASRKRYWQAEAQRRREDPERHRQALEDLRMRSAAWRRRDGQRERPKRRGLNRSPSVDAAPFAAWLTDKAAEYGGVRSLAEACGMSETRIYKIRGGEIPRVELASVDAALQHEGSTHLDDLYPMEAT